MIRSLFSSKALPFLLLLCAVAVLAGRAPELLYYPRFWAEDGVVHYQFAVVSGNVLESLSFIYWTVGYFNLSSNLAGTLAAFLPVRYAPYAPTVLAFAVQIIPLIIVVSGNSALFSSPARKVLGAALIVFAPVITEEVVFNTINAQIWLGVAGLLILTATAKRAGALWLHRATLALAGLSGLYVLFLYPLFVLRALLEKTRETWVQAGILTACLGIQGGIVLCSLLHNGLPGRQFLAGGITAFVDKWIDGGLLLPIMASEVFTQTTQISSLHTFLAMLAVGYLFFLLYTGIKERNAVSLYLLAAWALLSVLTQAGSLGGVFQGRYVVVSAYALLFVILHHAYLAQERWNKALHLGVLLTALGFGMYQYHADQHTYCTGKNREAVDMENLPICPLGWSIDFANPRINLIQFIPSESPRPRDLELHGSERKLTLAAKDAHILELTSRFPSSADQLHISVPILPVHYSNQIFKQAHETLVRVTLTYANGADRDKAAQATCAAYAETGPALFLLRSPGAACQGLLRTGK